MVVLRPTRVKHTLSPTRNLQPRGPAPSNFKPVIFYLFFFIIFFFPVVIFRITWKNFECSSWMLVKKKWHPKEVLYYRLLHIVMLKHPLLDFNKCRQLFFSKKSSNNLFLSCFLSNSFTHFQPYYSLSSPPSPILSSSPSPLLPSPIFFPTLFCCLFFFLFRFLGPYTEQLVNLPVGILEDCIW